QLKDTPVLILSALPDLERQARALGAVDVIPKPIDFDRMLDVGRAHCGDPRAPCRAVSGPRRYVDAAIRWSRRRRSPSKWENVANSMRGARKKQAKKAREAPKQ